jgi:beta-lactamase superfamily II metal-dependent hydrolase
MPDFINNTVTFENFLEAIENNNIDVHIPEPGDEIRAGSIYMQVISPPPGEHKNANDNSVVLRMVHGNTSFLFTGDAEIDAERWILENYTELQTDVLAVGHHGSRTSTSEAFLAAVNPSIAVIQVGKNNRYNHPHREILDRLNAHGAIIYRTDEIGTIRMITNGESIYFP